MQKTIKERIDYLEKQLAYYRSVNNQLAIDQTSAVINELFYWEYVYESDSFKKWQEAQVIIDKMEGEILSNSPIPNIDFSSMQSRLPNIKLT